MKDETRSFISKGLELYPDALDTVEAFQRELRKRLDDAVKGRNSWAPLKQCKTELAKFGAGGGEGCWVAVHIEARSGRGEDVGIDCGIWWEILDEGEAVIYASFWEKPKRLLAFKWSSEDTGIRCEVWKNRTFLYMPIQQSMDIAPSLNSVLDALLRQLGR